MFDQSKYVGASAKARQWGVSKQRVCEYCRDGRVPGAVLIGVWWIPRAARKPPEKKSGRPPCQVA